MFLILVIIMCDSRLVLAWPQFLATTSFILQSFFTDDSLLHETSRFKNVMLQKDVRCKILLWEGLHWQEVKSNWHLPAIRIWILFIQNGRMRTKQTSGVANVCSMVKAWIHGRSIKNPCCSKTLAAFGEIIITISIVREGHCGPSRKADMLCKLKITYEHS